MIADLLYSFDKDKKEIVESSLAFCKKYFDSVKNKDMPAEKDKYVRLWNIKTFESLEEKNQE